MSASRSRKGLSLSAFPNRLGFAEADRLQARHLGLPTLRVDDLPGGVFLMLQSPAWSETDLVVRRETDRGSGALVRYGAGQTIFTQGDRPDAVHMVESGLVALSMRHEDGRRHIVFLAGPGDVLCAPFCAHAPADADVIAPSQVRQYASRTVEHDVGLGMRINDQLQRQYERTLRHVFVLGQREARQRVSWLLASCADGQGTFVLPLSRQDMADYLGLTIETVSREFTRLKRMGVIGYERHGAVSILRPAALFAGAL
jgi:CRP/FNR family transcriptional regulator, anaerobic regulatory protein